MKAEDTDNTLSFDPAEQHPQGQGAFSLKPAGRRKVMDRRIILVVITAVMFVLVTVGGFAWMVIQKRSTNDTQVDESNVKQEEVTRGARLKDESMDDYMDKQASRNRAKAEKADRQQAKTDAQTETAKSTTEAKAGLNTPTSNVQPLPPRVKEALFSDISRFDSSGISSGTGGNSGYSRPSGAHEDQMRAFAESDPQAIVDKLIQAQQGSSTAGGDSGFAPSGRSGLLGNLGGTREYPATAARRMPTAKYLLKRRTRFQCVLYERIKTNYPGFVSCYLIRPLYSADGSVILAEAGAELIGEQNVEIKPGDSNVFTKWTELETAAGGNNSGVRASLNGLGTGQMGESGTEAYVDNHYGQRFGGAVMLSFWKDGLATASGAVNKSGNYNTSNTEQATEDIAAKALDATINIAPTGYVLPGTVINVVTAQDIDFSSVYTTRR